MDKTEHPPHSPFHFVISGDLEDFAAFCAIIRGENPDASQIAAQIAKLKAHTDPLVAAEAAQATQSPTLPKKP